MIDSDIRRSPRGSSPLRQERQTCRPQPRILFSGTGARRLRGLGRTGRLRPAGSCLRRRRRRTSLAAATAGPAPRVDPAVPRPGRQQRWRGAAPAGGQGPPAGQSAAGQPARSGCALRRQTRHALGRLRGPPERDLQRRPAPPDRERDHHQCGRRRLHPDRAGARGHGPASAGAGRAPGRGRLPPRSSWQPAPRGSTSSARFRLPATGRPAKARVSRSPTSRSTGREVRDLPARGEEPLLGHHPHGRAPAHRGDPRGPARVRR